MCCKDFAKLIVFSFSNDNLLVINKSTFNTVKKINCSGQVRDMAVVKQYLMMLEDTNLLRLDSQISIKNVLHEIGDIRQIVSTESNNRLVALGELRISLLRYSEEKLEIVS